MKSVLRIALLLMLPITADLSAQKPTPAVTPTTTEDTTSEAGTVAPVATATPGQTSEDVRQDFNTLLLRDNAPELGTILSLDPTLLSNEAFLSGYPTVSAFLVQHPEVRRNPRFYLASFEERNGRDVLMEDILQGLVIFATFLVAAFALGWLVRTIIEQRRWNRLSRTQSEVHNKILDRFSSSEELLAYIKSPAGSKFLESAPIPLHANQAVQNAPVSRIMWSIQLGVVIIAGSIGALLVSGKFDVGTARGISAIGLIGICLGAGFVASSIVSMILSRRLGLSRRGPGMNDIEDSMA